VQHGEAGDAREHEDDHEKLLGEAIHGGSIDAGGGLLERRGGGGVWERLESALCELCGVRKRPKRTGQ
jgi:hypothetical protein